MELVAAFERSAAHKLSGSKGHIRYNAVARFLQVWMPTRYTALTNVFASDIEAGPFKNQLDLVLHDSDEGSQWPLDGENENWIILRMHVKIFIKIKSTLDKNTWRETECAMDAVKGYSTVDSGSHPHKVLFAYQLDSEFAADPRGFNSHIMCPKLLDHHTFCNPPKGRQSARWGRVLFLRLSLLLARQQFAAKLPITQNF